MNLFNKISKILDNKDKIMLLVLFFIMVFTAILEVLNLGSLLALINIILNENQFLSILDKNIFLKNFIENNDTSLLIKILIIISIILLLSKSLILLFFFWIKNKFLFLLENI